MTDLFCRLSNGISFARIICIFWIFSIHYLQLPWFSQFTNGLRYNDAVLNIDLAWANAASQQCIFDRAFLWASYFGSNGVFCFFILSGYSLWSSLKLKGSFSLGMYFEDKFYRIYIPYAICVFLTFYFGVKLLYYIPKEYDLYGLLIGGAAFNLDWRQYNSPLWFISYLFILYLIFPFIVIVYKKLKRMGMIILFIISIFWFRHYDYFSLFSYFFCFMFGIILMEMVDYLTSRLTKSNSNIYFLYSAIGTVVFSGLGIIYYFYFQVPFNLNRPVYSSFGQAICVVLFVLSAGTLFPIRRNFLRFHMFLSRGTFSVYLYHYLLVLLFTRQAQDFDAFTKQLPEIFLNHISLTFITVFILILIICSIYQSFLDKVTGQAKKYVSEYSSRPLS